LAKLWTSYVAIRFVVFYFWT